MSENILEYIITAAMSAVLGIGGFFMKNVFTRLDDLEDQVNKSVTEQELRTILADKIDPVKEDVQEIKQVIVKIYELYLSERKS